MSRDDDGFATLPPPAGDTDAYSAETRVGELPPELMAELAAFRGELAASAPATPESPAKPAPPRPSPRSPSAMESRIDRALAEDPGAPRGADARAAPDLQPLDRPEQETLRQTPVAALVDVDVVVATFDPEPVEDAFDEGSSSVAEVAPRAPQPMVVAPATFGSSSPAATHARTAVEALPTERSGRSYARFVVIAVIAVALIAIGVFAMR